MVWPQRLWLKLQTLFRRNRNAQRLNAEMEFHLDQQIAENLAAGMSRQEARHAAMRTFGNPTFLKEETRDTWGWTWLEQLSHDLRHATRTLRKSPAFTAVAVLTLALGIGANTAIFSLIDVILLRPLPVRDSDRVVLLNWEAHKQPQADGYSSYGFCNTGEQGAEPEGCSFSRPFFQHLHSQAGIFSQLTAFVGSPVVHMDRNGERTRVSAPLVSGEFFQTMGVQAAWGRLLQPSDDLANAPPVAVLDYGYWQTQFGGDRSIVGRTIDLDNIPVTVVGVAEPDFGQVVPGYGWDLWLPLSLFPRMNTHWSASNDEETKWWLTIVGHLKPGVSLTQAQTAVSLFFRNEMLHGPTPLSKEADDPRISLLPVQKGLIGNRWQYKKPFYILMAAVSIVLLIACSNVSGLILARTASRQKEIAVRLALGAGRTRVICQLLAESALLSLTGGVIGVFFAYWSLAALRSTDWLGSIRDFGVRPDVRLLVFMVSVCVLAGILPGLAPALRGTRLDLTPALKENSRTLPAISQRGWRLRLGSALVVAQVTLSMLVLAGAGLLVRTLANLKSISPGFDTRNLLLVEVDLKDNEYNPRQAQNLYREIQSRFSSLPGVINVSYSSESLLSGSLWSGDIALEGRKKFVERNLLSVGPRFFTTMRIPLLAGRAFTPADFGSEHKVAVVNRAFVQKYLEGSSPIGLHLGASKDDPGTEIIGVAGDAKYDDLKKPVEPTEYFPLEGGRASFEIRTAAAPEALIPVARNIVRELDSHLPPPSFKTQSGQIDRSLFRERLVAHLSSLFGLLALGLACIGLYGLLSYEVTRRTREIGIRTAMGAQQRDVLRLVVGQGIALSIVGAALGIAGALVLTRYLDSLLYGVRPSDPETFVAVALLLTLVSLAASYIPARRAMHVDPMVALRYE
jgi:macrolide transport system ATP-binding/permease protein